jgi:hypothetical protein
MGYPQMCGHHHHTYRTYRGKRDKKKLVAKDHGYGKDKYRRKEKK